MRALLAAILVLGVTAAVANAVGSKYPHGNWPWWGTALVIASLFASIVVAYILLNLPFRRRAVSSKSFAEELAELEAKGLVLREPHKARRAFEVEEFEDEGAQYFVELEDRRVLFVCGQYLYEYQGTGDESDPANGRTFPCTEFTLLRRKEGEILDIICGGKVLPLDCEAPPFQGDFPADGHIITDRTYDQIKAERLKRS